LLLQSVALLVLTLGLEEPSCSGDICPETTFMLHTRLPDALMEPTSSLLELSVDDEGLKFGAGFRQQIREVFDAHMLVVDEQTKTLAINVNKVCGSKRVMISGLPRTASTADFMIAHIMLFFCENDWMPDERNVFIDPPEEEDCANPIGWCWKHINAAKNMILKSHAAYDDDRRHWPDVVIFSHRKPEEAIASMWLGFHTGCDIPPCVTSDWSWVTQEMERQACLYDYYPKDRILYDMPMEDLVNDRKKVFIGIARALGVTTTGKFDGDVPDLLIDHAMAIYDEAEKDLGRVENQKSHHSASHAKLIKAASDKLIEGVHGVSGKSWLDAAGAISGNPLVLKDHSMPVEYKSNCSLKWCRA